MIRLALRRFSLATLAANLLVILWGAYVRATGSGAGCGDHWPLCDGVIIPRSAEAATMIEYTHRLTSGLAFLMVVGLFLWVRRVFASGTPARVYATWAMVFIILEALIGAGLVLFELVAGNTSILRAVVGALHLLNTFLLLAAIVAVYASLDDPDAGYVKLSSRQGIVLSSGAFAMLFVGMSGAIAALGDTIFPSTSLLEGISAEFSRDAHFLLRLRVWHPLIAVVASIVILVGQRLPTPGKGSEPRLQLVLTLLISMQLFAGIMNVVLLAPVWMQILHLLLADLIWVALILLIVRTQRAQKPEAANQPSNIS